AEAALELELEPLDEHDILDGELPQHVRTALPNVTSAKRSGGPAACSRHRAASAPACNRRTLDNSGQAPRPTSALPGECQARDSIQRAVRAPRARCSSSDTGSRPVSADNSSSQSDTARMPLRYCPGGSLGSAAPS